MPDDPNVIGFTNRWYHPALSTKEKRKLPNGREIYVFSVPYYIATKIEAIRGRGGNDWRDSHDFEDLIYILNYCPDFVEQLRAVDTELRQYYIDEFNDILARPNIKEEIDCCLPYGEDERTDDIINIMRKITTSL